MYTIESIYVEFERIGTLKIHMEPIDYSIL